MEQDQKTEQEQKHIVAGMIIDPEKKILAIENWNNDKRTWRCIAEKIQNTEKEKEKLKKKIEDKFENAEFDVKDLFITVKETRNGSPVTINYYPCELKNDCNQLIGESGQWANNDQLFKIGWFPSDLKIVAKYLERDKVALVATIDELINFGGNFFVDSCTTFLKSLGFKKVKDELVQSWRGCFSFLIRHWPEEILNKKFPLLFEYMVSCSSSQTRGSGHCRPDVILLTKKKVIVFEFKGEFKGESTILAKDVGQVTNYAQLIRKWHCKTEDQKMAVSAVLVYTGKNSLSLDCTYEQFQISKSSERVRILSPQTFCDAVQDELKNEESLSEEECFHWVTSTWKTPEGGQAEAGSPCGTEVQPGVDGDDAGEPQIAGNN